MFDILRTTLMNALRGIQHACATAVIRDDDGDDGDIATPTTSFDEDF
jgi:hypothetical protein